MVSIEGPAILAAAPFAPFGRDHLAALALVAAVSLALLAVVRRAPRVQPFMRGGLALALAGATAATLIIWWRTGTLTVWDVLPFHLCDFLIVVVLFALLTLHPLACELIYFWGGAGTLLALVSPDVQLAFPHWSFLSFFVLHGLVVISAVVVTFGFDHRPRPGAVWRVFALTNAYAVVVALVNLAWGTNYLFLRRPPQAPTLVDWLGPWPWYIATADALALLLFFILAALARPRNAG